MTEPFDLVTYIQDQQVWSAGTFGPGPRTEGICRHIEKELAEIRADPKDLMEFIDVLILAIDGAWRAGYFADEIVDALCRKQLKNFSRTWPTPGPQDEPIEHVRAGE